MNNKGSSLTPAQALEKLDALYEQSVNALRSAISDYIETGKLPDEKARTQGLLFIHRSLSPGTAAPAAIRKPAPMRVSPTPAVTARPSRDLRCSAPTWKSSLPCCIRITARISALNRPCTRSLTRT